MQKWWTEISMTERRKSIRGRKIYRNSSTMQKSYFRWIELQATALATSWNTARENHSIHGKQDWAFGLILVLMFGDSNGPWSLSPGSLYDLDLGHLYLIPLLISGLSNWSWSLPLGSVWSWSWSLGFLILVLKLGSLCDPRLGLYVVHVNPVLILGVSVWFWF